MNDALTEPPAAAWTTQEAITRAQQGDSAAFEHLYKAHSKHVYSVCLRMLKNTAEAEDLTQQVFLHVFRKIGTFRGESVFSTWLHRVTLNIVLMHLRRNRTAVALGDRFDDNTTDGNYVGEFAPPDTSAAGVIDRLNLARAIQELPSCL